MAGSISDKRRHRSDPVLVQTIITKAAEEKKKAIYGLTILDKELFVVSERSSEVEVYDSMKLSFSRRWKLKELIDPFDIRSCSRTRPKCLYISDGKIQGQSKEIFKVQPNGELIKKWSTGNDTGRLSVTDTGEPYIILIAQGRNKLNIYLPDGKLIDEINLSSNAGILNPRHAIKLTNGQFVVSHGVLDRELHRVCVVDAEGKIKKSFGGKPGSAIGHMKDPIYLSVDGDGFVMVADRGNRRVLLLDPDLEFQREILSREKHGLRNPNRILLDESNGRLFVTDSEYNATTKCNKDGRILIYSFY